MWTYGLIGFITGFIAGMILNAYLLRNIPKETYMNDREMRNKYGLLNWFIAFLVMSIAIAIGQTKL